MIEVQIRSQRRLGISKIFSNLYLYRYSKTPLTNGEEKHHEETWISNIGI